MCAGEEREGKGGNFTLREILLKWSLEDFAPFLPGHPTGLGNPSMEQIEDGQSEHVERRTSCGGDRVRTLDSPQPGDVPVLLYSPGTTGEPYAHCFHTMGEEGLQTRATYVPIIRILNAHGRSFLGSSIGGGELIL